MENNQPTERFSPAEVEAVKEKFRGKVLTDSEVIKLVSSPGEIDIPSLVQWHGFGINSTERPIARFSSILKQYYEGLNPGEKLQLLTGASRFVLFGVRSGFLHPEERTGFDGNKYIVKKMINLGSESTGANRRDKVNNIGELLVRALEFCNNDTDEARALLRLQNAGNLASPSKNEYQGILYRFVRPNSVETTLFTERNEKVSELAFWLAVDSGDFSTQSKKFTQLLEDLYPTLTDNMKPQILKYVAQTAASPKTPRQALAEIKSFLISGEEDYMLLKESEPQSEIVSSYELAQAALIYQSLLERTKNGRIEAEDLVDILEKNPKIISFVTQSELEAALDSTKDHGVALRIETIIRAKKSAQAFKTES